MADDDPELTPEHYALLSNAGRCDICGKPIDMSSGDHLEIHEFGLPDDIKDDYDISDEEAAESVAETLESVGDTGADYELARVIRDKLAFKTHADCLSNTAYDVLTVSDERAEELGIP